MSFDNHSVECALRTDFNDYGTWYAPYKTGFILFIAIVVTKNHVLTNLYVLAMFKTTALKMALSHCQFILPTQKLRERKTILCGLVMYAPQFLANSPKKLLKLASPFTGALA